MARHLRSSPTTGIKAEEGNELLIQLRIGAFQAARALEEELHRACEELLAALSTVGIDDRRLYGSAAGGLCTLGAP